MRSRSSAKIKSLICADEEALYGNNLLFAFCRKGLKVVSQLTSKRGRNGAYDWAVEALRFPESSRSDNVSSDNEDSVSRSIREVRVVGAIKRIG